MPFDDTYNPALENWIKSAHAPQTDFPIQNLPLIIVNDCLELAAFNRPAYFDG